GGLLTSGAVTIGNSNVTVTTDKDGQIVGAFWSFPSVQIPVADWMSSYTQSGVSQTTNVASFSTPLVVDLDGNGVELTSLSGIAAAPVYWDSNNDGFREAMAWVKAGDGLLVRDLNGNGIIDNHSELFGNATTDGFVALSALDTNGSHTITSADASFG